LKSLKDTFTSRIDASTVFGAAAAIWVVFQLQLTQTLLNLLHVGLRGNAKENIVIDNAGPCRSIA
jgi:hypothetical protein